MGLLGATTLALALALMILQRRLLPSVAAEGAPAARARLSRPGRWALAVVLVAATTVHAWMAARYPSEGGETLALERGCYFHGIGDGAHDLANAIHAPLHSLLVGRWLQLLDALGLGPGRWGLFWLRLPNLGVSAVAMLLVARTGVMLGAELAGLGAAALVGLLPLPLHLSVPQENYLLELVGAAWFVERAVAWLVERRPVYRSLAVSSAVALYGGYMTVLVLAPGALLLGAVALRRRQLREAGYTLALVALLVAPLVPVVVRAGLDYLAATPRGPMSAAQRAALEARLGHSLYDLSGSFSSGSWAVGVRVVGQVLFGRVAEALFAVGAVLALLTRRARALPLLAVVALFLFASTRVTLHLQNLGPLVVPVLLLVAWGIDGVPFPRAGRAALQLAAVGLAIGSAHASHPLGVAGGRLAPLEYWDAGALLGGLESRPPDTPLLVYRLHTPDAENLLLCPSQGPGAERLCERVTCARSGATRAILEAGAWSVARRGEREVASPIWELALGRMEPLDPLPSALAEVLARPAWRRGWLALRGPYRQHFDAVYRALDAYLDARCRPIAGTGRHVLMACGAVADGGEGGARR